MLHLDPLMSTLAKRRFVFFGRFAIICDVLASFFLMLLTLFIVDMNVFLLRSWEHAGLN